MSDQEKINSLNGDITKIIKIIRNNITQTNREKLSEVIRKLNSEYFNSDKYSDYNSYYKKILGILPSSYKSQFIGLNLTRTNNNPIVELLAKGIAFILKYANQLFYMLKKIFDDGIISDFEENGLYSTNAFPGFFTVLIVIFLIIFLFYSSIQSFFKWISAGFIKLPDLPISLDRRYTQFVYSFFHLLVSGYLVFVIFISYFKDLLKDLGLNEEDGVQIKENLDIIVIGKRIIKALYLLWIIAIVLIGSTIAKAFYKMACNGANTNIDSFAKIIDSSVVLTLLVSIILIIFLKIKDFINLVGSFFSDNVSKLQQYYDNITINSRFFVTKQKIESEYNRLNESPEDPKNKEEVKKSQKILELIFNFDVIYFVLRVITLMYEEFASDNLVFLLGRMGEESPLNNCNPDGDDCDKDNFKETLKNFISGGGLWISSIIVLFIQFNWNKSSYSLDQIIGDNIKNILKAFVAMLDGELGSGEKYEVDKKSFKDYFTDLKNSMSTAKNKTKTGLPGELKRRSEQAANKTGYYSSRAQESFNSAKDNLKQEYSIGESRGRTNQPVKPLPKAPPLTMDD